MKVRKEIGTGIKGIVAIYMVVSILALSGYQITQISLLAGILFAGVLVLMHFYQKYKTAEYRNKSALMALVVSTSVVCGDFIRKLDSSGKGNQFSILGVVWGIGLFLFLLMLIQCGLYLLKKLSIKVPVGRLKEKSSLWREWGIVTGVLLVLWLPYFLTFFPGILGSDPIESLRQCLDMIPWTNHHPVLYTGFMKLFVSLFSNLLGINGALACMTFTQQVILAGTLSYVLCFMKKQGVSEIVWGFTFLFVSINPVVAVFSVYATKDVLYSAMLILWCLQLYQLATKKELHFIWFGLNAIFVILLRNNGIFLTIGTLLVLLWTEKQMRKKMGMYLLLCVLTVVLQKQVVFPLLQMEEGSFAESLSIPLQQIAQAAVDGAVMTEEEEEYVSALLPLDKMAEVYQAGYTDMVKFDEDFQDDFLNEHKGEFIKVWFGMLPHNFGSYVKAYLLQTAGYWDVSQTESLTIYGVVENELNVRQTDWIKQICGKSVQPLVEKLILVCRKMPVLCYLTNMAMMVFGLLFSTCLLWGEKNKRVIICLIPLWLTWGTIMIAAPASCKFRYLLPIYMMIPFILWITVYHGIGDKADEIG